ncbi:MBL fold metallo-hydrolase [Desulfosporosinus lacus]|uniref:Metal-dependent hydrolase, beta-lactamase superfamily II n=1 Tax=Desulfosporosinus lacus DSM 15449 TaxID=1121420 RepID=A0A1M6E873_9FIRM|nr:MBL fold metallo-hydrolase [Desulfosporosinus lacus]SHI81540.1 Metal-dependent hydrolase, beta-lactamase superfamily II [Desulfosporosinus lacus DSM 15449]
MLFRIKQFILPIIIFSVFGLSGCGRAEIAPAQTVTGTNGILQVHFIDVGQADSILLISPDGESILIDGGNNDDGPEVVSYLKSQGVKELSAIVATHPHEDHIGGLDSVIQSIPPKTVYMPNVSPNTRTFEDFTAAVNISGAKKVQAKAGVSLNGPDIMGIFLAPNNSSYEELNNYSAVLKVTYGKVSFLFEGDAEDISEEEMLRNRQNLKATVLKVGHHGSKSSTTSEFLKAVSPQYAIISVGADNEYGHPTATVLDRFAEAGIEVFRTDQSGTIVASTDGEVIKFDKNVSTPSASTSQGLVELSNVDLRGEAVTITNRSNTAVNLTGWKLVSEVGNQIYNFPADTTLTPGGSLKVVSGEKARAGSDSLLWTESNIWNNDGDPAALYDAQGQLAAKR